MEKATSALHWSDLGPTAYGLLRLTLITLSAFIFSTDHGNRGHSAVLVIGCSDSWANTVYLSRPEMAARGALPKMQMSSSDQNNW